MQVYDAAVEAAKLGSGAGPHRLATDGSWAWLLQRLALQYGVRVTYAGLASVRWITAKPERLIPTSDCLNLLVTELGPLHRAATTMMAQVRSACMLLAGLMLPKTTLSSPFMLPSTLSYSSSALPHAIGGLEPDEVESNAPQEAALLKRLRSSAEELLLITLENYHLLSSDEPSGLLPAASQRTELPPLALKAAIRLFGASIRWQML